MTASSGVVLSNLAYLIGAVVVAFIGGLLVWLHHRQPKSVDANVESFQRGLQAIAPDSTRPVPVRAHGVSPLEGLQLRPRSSVTLRVARSESASRPVGIPADADDAVLSEPAADLADLTDHQTRETAGAGDGAGGRAEAETG
jgi:hypothetical protein